MNSHKLPVTIVFFIVVGVVPVYAQFNQAVWDTITSDSLEDHITSQAIAVNGYEQFHLVYDKALLNGSAQICYRFYDMLAGFSPEIVAYNGYEVYNPVIASIMGDEIAEVAVVFERGGDLVMCRNSIPPGPWDFENFTNTYDDDYTPSICYDYYDPMVAWVRHYQGEYKIKFARWDGDSVYIETIEDSQLGDYGYGAKPFIVEYQSKPHIFYRGVNNNAYNIHHAYKVHPDSNWEIENLETPNDADYSVTAAVNGVGDLYIAISGNDGWGMPSHIYFLEKDHDTGIWSSPELVTGANSATNASILYRPGHQIFIASCGVSGNIYDGNVYLSNNLSGSFETQLLASYNSVTQPVLSDIIGEYGMLIFDALVNGETNRNVELVYYGPQLNDIVDTGRMPIASNLPNAYPNPFNSQAKIAFTIDRPGRVTLEIFDIAGRRVESLIGGDFAAGKYEVTWNADNFASGMYFYRLSTAGQTLTRKMLLLK